MNDDAAMQSMSASPASPVVLHTRVKDARAIVQVTCALPLAVLPPELVRAADAGNDRPRLCRATILLQTQAATPGAPWTTLYTFLPHEAVATCGPPGVCDTALPTPAAAVHVTLLHTGLATLQRLLSLTTTPQSSHAPYGMPPHGYRLIAILQPATGASKAHSLPGLVLTLPLHGVSPFRTSRVDMGLWFLLQQRAHAALRSTMAVLHRRGVGAPAPHEPQVMVEVEHATEDTCNPCNACAARDSQESWTAAACPLAIGAMAARAWSPSGACSTTPFLMHLYPRLPLRTLHVNTVRDGRKTVLCLGFPTLPIPHTLQAVLAEAAHASAAACGDPLLPLALLAHCEKHADGGQQQKHAGTGTARRAAPFQEPLAVHPRRITLARNASGAVAAAGGGAAVFSSIVPQPRPGAAAVSPATGRAANVGGARHCGDRAPGAGDPLRSAHAPFLPPWWRQGRSGLGAVVALAAAAGRHGAVPGQPGVGPPFQWILDGFLPAGVTTAAYPPTAAAADPVTSGVLPVAPAACTGAGHCANLHAAAVPPRAAATCGATEPRADDAHDDEPSGGRARRRACGGALGGGTWQTALCIYACGAVRVGMGVCGHTGGPRDDDGHGGLGTATKHERPGRPGRSRRPGRPRVARSASAGARVRPRIQAHAHAKTATGCVPAGRAHPGRAYPGPGRRSGSGHAAGYLTLLPNERRIVPVVYSIFGPWDSCGHDNTIMRTTFQEAGAVQCPLRPHDPAGASGGAHGMVIPSRSQAPAAPAARA